MVLIFTNWNKKSIMAPILCWRHHFLVFAKKRTGIRWHNFSHLHFEAFPEGISQNGCARWIQRLILMKIRLKSCVWWRFCFAETSANFRFFHFFTKMCLFLILFPFLSKNFYQVKHFISWYNVWFKSVVDHPPPGTRGVFTYPGDFTFKWNVPGGGMVNHRFEPDITQSPPNLADR